MAWRDPIAATQLTSITTAQWFTWPGSTKVVDLNPGELAIIFMKATEAGSTDDTKFTIWESIKSAPGDPSSSTADWAILAEITHDTSAVDDGKWISARFSGAYKIAVSVERVGTTDTIDSADCELRRDGVSAG